MNNQTSTVIALFAYYQISDDKINLSENRSVSNRSRSDRQGSRAESGRRSIDGFASRIKKRYSEIYVS
jgi:hypothetical protein